MPHSILPRLRRISQIFFLLLFLALLVLTSMRPPSAASSDIHMRGPVRMFFVLDPLVAISNALATHAIYRGLIWSFLILLPTLFLGRFFCGWICPMGTLQHFIGNMRSEAKRGKQRIESNRYKRWQTIKYVVLLAGLVAAVFGSAVIGTLEVPSASLSAPSVSLSFAAFGIAVRALLVPMEHSHIAAIRSVCFHFSPLGSGITILDLRQSSLCAESRARDSLPRHPLGQHAYHSLLVPVHLSARSIARRRLRVGPCSGPHKDSLKLCDKCNRCLLNCQGGDDPIGGVLWHKSECLMCMNCVDELPAQRSRIPLFPDRKGKSPSPDAGRRRALTRNRRRASATVPLIALPTTGLGKSRHAIDCFVRPVPSTNPTSFPDASRCGECMKV